jgi:hypothetical protein
MSRSPFTPLQILLTAALNSGYFPGALTDVRQFSLNIIAQRQGFMFF